MTTPDLSLWASDEYVRTHAAAAFRPLRLRPDWTRGADVFALQGALHAYHAEIGRDGIFGPQTERIVRNVQELFALVVDGIAGGVTQHALSVALAKSIGPVHGLPEGVPLGHVQQESSGLPGNYGALYTTGDAKGSRDEGVVMMNTRFFAADVAFDPVAAINDLCVQVKAKHAKYRATTVDDVRAWQLACGSWNAPAWTDALARGDSIGDANRVAIETYIDHVTAFAPSLN